MFIISSHCHVPCVSRKIFQVYLLYHLPKDVGEAVQLVVPQIFLLPLRENRNDICFVLVLRNLTISISDHHGLLKNLRVALQSCQSAPLIFIGESLVELISLQTQFNQINKCYLFHKMELNFQYNRL